MNVKLLIQYLAILTIPVLFCQNIVSAQTNEAGRLKHFNLQKRGTAIGGYDPVSYFTYKKPLKGKKENSYTHKGVTYYFNTLNNKKAFLKEPEKYEPAYGGWCAYAMGVNGEKIKVNPETYKIVGGRLHLFYNFNSNNTLKPWNQDEANLKEKADKNWNGITK